MPAKSPYRRIVITGIVVLMALAIFAVIARRTFLSYQFDLVTFVDDSAGIAPSSPVLLNGISIGHVRRVSLSGSKDPNRTVRIDMRFNRAYLSDIPEDSTVAIRAANLLGDKFVDIYRGSHPTHIAPHAEVRSTDTLDIGTVLARGTMPLQQVNDIFNRIDRILKYIDNSEGTVGKLVNDKSFEARIDGITASVKQIEADFKTGRGAALHLDEIKVEAHKPLSRLNEMLGDLNHGQGSLGMFLHDPSGHSLTAEVNATIAEAKRVFQSASSDNRPADLLQQVRATDDKIGILLDRIDAGQGTLGQVLVNPQLRDSLNHARRELNSLTTAIGQHPARFVQLRFGLF